MASPFPNLQIYPNSGLTFAWTWATNTRGVSSESMGDDGVVATASIYINWSDLPDACQQLLGYTSRVPVVNDLLQLPGLHRVAPWQHPYWNQLYVKRITDVRGLRSQGSELSDPEELFFWLPELGEVGLGLPTNYGPWPVFALAEITLAWWVPPYYIRSDDDILDEFGVPQEWLRWVDKTWSQQSQIISREGSFLRWSLGLSPTGVLNVASGVPSTGTGEFPGSVGTPISHERVSRRWWNIPEQCIFSPVADGTPNGVPLALKWCQSKSVNPITGYIRDPSAAGVGQWTYPITSCLNLPIYGGTYSLTGTFTAGSRLFKVTASPAGTPTVGDFIPTIPTVGPCLPGTFIMSPSGGGMGNWFLSSFAQLTGTFTVTVVSDATQDSRFFGCPMGTLRYDGYHLEPQPLQLPPYLMAIPAIAGNEALSKVQYNVILDFDMFDPERLQIGTSNDGTNLLVNVPLQPHRGHNLMPFAGDTLWYPCNSKSQAYSTDGNKYFLTPFNYARFEDLFQVI